MARRSRARTPESHTLPEPERPDEVYRGFESLNRRRGRGLPGLAGLSGRKALYGLFAVTEVAAIVLGFFLKATFVDTLAMVPPGLLVLVHGGPKEAEQERPDGKEGVLPRERIRKRLRRPSWSGSCGASATRTPPSAGG